MSTRNFTWKGLQEVAAQWASMRVMGKIRTQSHAEEIDEVAREQTTADDFEDQHPCLFYLTAKPAGFSIYTDHIIDIAA